MHLADAFIQSDLHCIQVTVFTFYRLLLSHDLGIASAMLYHLSYRKATENLYILMYVCNNLQKFAIKLLQISGYTQKVCGGGYASKFDFNH